MKKGDIIYVSVARAAGFGPRHYGIYDGLEGVYHFNGESIDHVYIQYSSMEQFAQGGEVKIDGQYKQSFTPAEIMQRAANEVGSEFGGYNLIDNNCEHFATWCVTGEKQSMQTDLVEEISRISPIEIIKKFFRKESSDGSSTPQA